MRLVERKARYLIVESVHDKERAQVQELDDHGRSIGEATLVDLTQWLSANSVVDLPIAELAKSFGVAITDSVSAVPMKNCDHCGIKTQTTHIVGAGNEKWCPDCIQKNPQPTSVWTKPVDTVDNSVEKPVVHQAPVFAKGRKAEKKTYDDGWKPHQPRKVEGGAVTRRTSIESEIGLSPTECYKSWKAGIHPKEWASRTHASENGVREAAGV